MTKSILHPDVLEYVGEDTAQLKSFEAKKAHANEQYAEFTETEEVNKQAFSDFVTAATKLMVVVELCGRSGDLPLDLMPAASNAISLLTLSGNKLLL